jgi:hypothetical protein
MLRFSRESSRIGQRIGRCAACTGVAVVTLLVAGAGCSSGGGSSRWGGSVVQKAHVLWDTDAHRSPARAQSPESRAFGQRLEEARLTVKAGFAGTVVVKFREFPRGRMILHVNENSPVTLLEIRSAEGGGGQPLAGTIVAAPVDRTITIEAVGLPEAVQGQQQCEVVVATGRPAAPAAETIQRTFSLARVCKMGPDGPTDSMPLADITFDLAKK